MAATPSGLQPAPTAAVIAASSWSTVSECLDRAPAGSQGAWGPPGSGYPTGSALSRPDPRRQGTAYTPMASAAMELTADDVQSLVLPGVGSGSPRRLRDELLAELITFAPSRDGDARDTGAQAASCRRG